MKPLILTFTNENRFRSYNDFITYIDSIDLPFIKTNKKIEYANVPCVIDIESSSFYDTDGNKVAIMYAFTLGINGVSYLGRTYDELETILNHVVDAYGLNKDRRLIFYIHNLGYEFQFFYKHFSWRKVFAIKSRTPLTALMTNGIELRCSFLLSGYSLEQVGKHLTKYPVEKLVGDLNYSLIRHAETPLTDKEKGYILHDGLVVMAYIQEQIESHKNDITKIPLTKTGEVRKYCRDACLYNGGGSHKKSVNHYRKYRAIMNDTIITSVNEYKQLKRAFMGGFTHANALCTGNVVHDVDSFDFTSSYPYVMVSEQFPMLRGELFTPKNKEEFELSIKCYCCVFDVTFTNLESLIFFEHYISQSHCRDLEQYKVDNGRIVSAKRLSITITDVDFKIIRKVYTWDKMTIKNLRRYKRGYLPTPFVKSILELYKTKTMLKDVAGKEVEYMNSKELINSCYGMCVTDICRSEVPFDYKNNQWLDTIPEIDYKKTIEHYNNTNQRFLSYAWGIFVTAYARANLWSGILEFKNHYLYSDTDSIKVIHAEEHEDYIKRYNNQVLFKLKRAMDYHGLSMDYVSPKTIKGVTKTLGVWDKETENGKWKRFKTLGAKRYMVEEWNGKQSLTISGVNKKIAIPYLQSKGDIFTQFQEDMYIPKGFTGKNIHTYIDEERDGNVIDYLGNSYHYHELSGIHMEDGDYTLSLARDYIDYLMEIITIEYN